MRSTAARSWLHEGRLDRAGIILSGLCAVHCVTTIAVMALLASVGGTLLHPAIHEIGLGLAVLLGIVALGAGYLRHGRKLPTLIGGGGLAVMALALTLPHGVPEAIATLSGVGLLAFGHHLNRRAGC
ncbi:MerC domain-containing protein [uncultured Sphingomonas sp.]|uniref:MerC domain-containing protein n=1 Tax=uncultured Sphingomonas sp. TaxID=158754 RepID=UPI0025854D35|nr:MerC domain-containing protein [uncultured Sphingomonas sp.]